MKYLTFLTFILIALNASAGGPWTQQKGAYYVKISESWLEWKSHYTNDGNRAANATSRLFSSNLYGEYGLSDKLTIGLNAAPLVFQQIDDSLNASLDVVLPEESLIGIGDADLFARYSLGSWNNIYFALEGRIGIPLGKTEAGDFNRLASGDGEFNQMALVHAGSGFSKNGINAYLALYGGFNNRGNGFSEELRYGGEVGIGVFDKRLWVTARLNATESLKNGKEGSQTSFVSLYSNNVEFVSPSFEVNFYITKKLGLSYNYATANSAENIAASAVTTVGIFLDMSKQ